MARVAKKPLVLIAVNQAALARQLIRSTRHAVPGVRLKLARNGKQTLDKCAALKPALLIANIALPAPGGAEVLKALRQAPGLAKLPVILLSNRPDAALVRALSPLSPSALLTLPLNEVRLLELLHVHLAGEDPLPASLSLQTFLDRQRDRVAELSGLQGVRRAVADCLSQEQHGRLLHQQCEKNRTLHKRLAKRASQIAKHPCETPEQIITQLGLAHSFNLALELQLEDAGQLADARLTDCLRPFLEKSRQTARLAAWLARQLRMDTAQCYLSGLLLSLGEFAVAQSLQHWQHDNRELGDGELELAMQQHAARFGSALRIGWRLPIPLRECVAGYYSLKTGVHTREALVLSLTGQLMALGDRSPTSLLEERAVRMLGIGLPLLQAIPQTLLEPSPRAAE